MLTHSKGIVIKTTRFSETTVIAKIYTSERGMLSFYIPGVYGKRPSVKPAYLQPLQVLDLNFYFRENKNLLKIKEAKTALLLERIHFDVIRSSIAVFITEIIHKTVKEEETNLNLFGFLLTVIGLLDEPGRNFSLFPLQFLLDYTKFTGFFPSNNFSEEMPYFDIREGKFVNSFPGFENGLDIEESKWLSNLMKRNINESGVFEMPANQKNELLRKMISFYRYHQPGLGVIKSVEVLTEIFDKKG